MSRSCSKDARKTRAASRGNHGFTGARGEVMTSRWRKRKSLFPDRVAPVEITVRPEHRSDPEAECGQRLARERLLEHSAKPLHCRAMLPRPGYNKIVMLVLGRDEPEPILPGDRLNSDPPIGSALRHGDPHGIVRFRLRPIASRLCSSQQAICQDAGAAACVAVDHQAIRRSDRFSDRVFEVPPLETRVAV